jgi:succinate dehydrogenase / fumarate reductase, cytochrome b subunit
LSQVDRATARATANVGAGNWKGLGMWAWILFRIAGVVLVLYLFAHIGVISSARLGNAGTIDSLFRNFDKTLFILLDLLLVWAVLFHGLNGVRIVLMDMGIGIHRHKLVFWICMAAAVVIFAFFAAAAFDYLRDKGVEP